MAPRRDPIVQTAAPYKASRRKIRAPSHKFNLRTLPYQLQPFMLAPVLPGETLQNMLLQARCVTDPLQPLMKLIGWHKEYYWFYVKLRDFMPDVQDDMAQMILNPDWDPTPMQSVADAKYYHFGGGINYAKECLKVVMEQFFRDEGENWDSYLIDGLPAVKIYGRGTNDAFDKMTDDTDYDTQSALMQGNSPSSVIAADGSWEDMDIAQQQWLALRDAGLMALDFQDWVKQYGVTVREEETSINLHKPELIRYIREWSYPTNTVEPTTGIPSTAVSWSIANRADKRMFFTEPGFIFGATCARPKVYLDKQVGSIAHAMDNVRNWLPAAEHLVSNISHMEFKGDKGPVPSYGANTTGYWLDVRDLMAYGDQYLNYARGSAVPGIVDLPKRSGGHALRRYATKAEVDAMFVVSDASLECIKEDGVVNLSILGRQSPQTSAMQLGSGNKLYPAV